MYNSVNKTNFFGTVKGLSDLNTINAFLLLFDFEIFLKWRKFLIDYSFLINV